MQQPILIFAAIGFISLSCQWLAWKLRLPSILLLLICGILAGPVTHFISPQAIFGSLFIPIINISAAIILFEGSLTLNFKQTKGLGTFIINLLTIGVITTFSLTCLISHYLLQLSWPIALILAAIMTVTGPTVMTPMLRAVRPTQRIAKILKWEGILIDPIGVILAIIAYGLISSYYEASNFYPIALDFLRMLAVSLPLGLGIGYSIGQLIIKHWIPDFLYNITILIMVVVCYALANLVDEGSGLLAVTLMGFCLGNMKNVPIDEILGFKESLTLLLLSGLFILLAASIEFTGIEQIILPSMVLFLLLQFVIRPLAVLLCSYQSTLNWRELIMISWIAPRGIIAATIAALFSIRLKTLGIADTDQLVLISFMIILLTVVFQSITAGPLASKLKVREPVAQGLLIIGANPVAIAVGRILKQLNILHIIACSSWRQIKQAQSAGLETYYGNPVSEHADRHLDLIGIGKLFALSRNDEINSLACLRYKPEFGREHTHCISNTNTNTTPHSKATSIYQNNPPWPTEYSHLSLETQLKQGSEMKAILMEKPTSLDDYKKQNPDHLPLFIIDEKKQILTIARKKSITVKNGQHLIVLKMINSDLAEDSK